MDLYLPFKNSTLIINLKVGKKLILELMDGQQDMQCALDNCQISTF